MEPEKIDELFRDKLSGLSANPAPDAWMRLQQKMESPQKTRTMWVYYAAASLVILLVSVVLHFKTANSPDTRQAVTVAPAFPPAEVPAAISPPRASEAAQEPAAAPARATASLPAAQKASASLQPPPASQPKKAGQRRAPEPVALAATRQAAPVVALPGQPAAPEQAKPTDSQSAATAPAFDVIEVVVTRSPVADSDTEPGFRENLHRKGKMLKNIYQQARNLKNGEPVELAALGVDKTRIQEETKELKQKISNVISL